jgi:hypothetical protein
VLLPLSFQMGTVPVGPTSHGSTGKLAARPIDAGPQSGSSGINVVGVMTLTIDQSLISAGQRDRQHRATQRAALRPCPNGSRRDAAN